MFHAFVACLPLALLASATAALDQSSGRRRVEGTVVDEARRAVSGARVSVSTPVTTPVATTTSTTGAFAVDVPSGAVDLIVEASGYAPARVALAAGQEETVITLTHLPGFAAELTVTATAGETRLAETPASVVVLSERELAATAAGSLDDALRQVPGFSLFRRSGSRAANPTTQGAFLRGVGASGASRALVLDDGVPLNDAFGGWVQWGRVPRAAVSRIEVLRGGASDLHGNAALAGVVHLVRRPLPRPSLRLEGSFGGQGSSDVSGHGGLRFGRWTAVAAAEAFRTDGYVTVDPRERGRVDVPADSRHLTLEAGLEHARDAGQRVFLRAGLFDEERQNGTPVQDNDTRSYELRAGTDWRTSAGAFSVRGFTQDQVYRQDFSAVTADRNSEVLTRSQRVPVTATGLLARWRREVGARHLIAAGIDLRRVSGTSEETAFAAGRASPGSAGGRQDGAGAFVEALLHPAERLRILGGLRLDAWRNREGRRVAGGVTTPLPERSEQALSPRVSVHWRPGGGVALTAAAYRSFRGPTLNELFRTFRVGNVVTLANEGLGAERLRGLEAGLATAASGRLSARATVFWMEVERTIANVTLTAAPDLITRQRKNLGRTRSVGLELDAEWHPAAGTAVSAGWLLVGSTVREFAADTALEGRDVPQVPRHQLTLQIRVDAPAGAQAALQARFTSGMFEDDRNEVRLGRAAAVDLLLTRAMGRRLEALVAVENAFDSRYDVGRLPARSIGPPRQLRAGLRLRLGGEKRP